MHQNISILNATAEDIPDIVRLRRLMFVWMHPFENDLLDKSDIESAKYFLKAIPDGTFHGWIAKTNDGKIVGTGGLVIDQHPPSPSNPTGKIGYIMNMSVDPDFRKQGIDDAVLKTILIHIKNNAITLVSLHASEMGKNLYEKVGFTPTNEMRLKLDSIDINQLFK